MKTKLCAACGARFTARRRDATTCSATCRQRAHRARLVEQVPAPEPESPVKGPSVPVRAPAAMPRDPDTCEPAARLRVPVAKVRVPVEFDVFGNAVEWVEAEPEAAAHWNAQSWRST
jgi:hypothetical protein